MNETESLMLPQMTDIWQQTLNWQPSTEQQQLFQQLYEGILEGNRQLNLTRITEPMEFWEKHLWDSLRGVWSQESGVVGAGLANNFNNQSISRDGFGSQFNQADKLLKAVKPAPTQNPPGKELEGKGEIQHQSLKIIDIGTGAGFPGLPVAIAFPHHSVTLLDSTRKKISFLETLIAKLGIKNVTTLIGRAEAIAQQLQNRQTYDMALLRAVAPAPVCAEYALPLLKTGGLAILYRGHWTDEETEALKPIVEKLGGAIASIEGFTTPISNSIRHCIYLRSYLPLKEVPIKRYQQQENNG